MKENYREIISTTKNDVIVIGNFEKMILEKTELDEMEIAEEIFNELKELGQQVEIICVCTDIGRGVVPIEEEIT